jgi:multidrug efflux pump subunit AcrB
VVSIPLSILIALILLPRFNITLNIMSLGGIAVAIGRIVDDSIVVIENVYRRVQRGEGKEGMTEEELIESATKEVSSAITSSTITTVAVFLPLTFVSGMIGKVFTPFAFTVVICILASLLVAVTVVPVLSKLMLLNSKKKHVEKESKIVNAYNKVLLSALNHKLIVLVVSLILLLSSFGLVSKVGIQFMPSDTTAVLTGKLTLTPGTSLAKTNEEALRFEKYLMNNKNVKTVVSSVGDTSGATGVKMSLQGSNAASFTIILKDGINRDKAAAEIINKTKEFSGAGESLMVQSQSTTGQKDNFEIVVNGANNKDISEAAALITKEIKGIKEFSNITDNLSEKKKEISIEVDKDKAALKGLSPVMVAGIVRGMLTDSTLMTLTDNGKDVEVVMGYDNKSIDTLDKVKNIEMDLMGNKIKLMDIADVSEKFGPVSISELDGNQYASITADLSGKNTTKASNAAMKKIDAIKGKLPSSVTYSLGGSSKQITDTFGQMGLAMLLAVLMVYIVMVLAFGEATAPFAILFSLPFAGVGAIIALFITGQPLTISGLIGMLMLIGIVVTNAIVLLDRVQTNRKKGMSINDSLLEAGSIRLRPIFMTAIATVMALMPLALGFSEGTIISQGLGIVVIGGLSLSTVLTLVIVPVMYASLQGFKEKHFRRGGAIK